MRIQQKKNWYFYCTVFRSVVRIPRICTRNFCFSSLLDPTGTRSRSKLANAKSNAHRRPGAHTAFAHNRYKTLFGH